MEENTSKELAKLIQEQVCKGIQSGKINFGRISFDLVFTVEVEVRDKEIKYVSIKNKEVIQGFTSDELKK
jgi:hypothetical protein